MLRNTREKMSIPGSVIDCQPAPRVPEESYINSRKLATSLAILKREGIENSGSEEPLQSIFLFCFQGKCKDTSLSEPSYTRYRHQL